MKSSNKPLSLKAYTVVVFSFFLLCSSLVGQTLDTLVDVANELEAGGGLTLIEMFQQGGIAMYPLLVFSILTLGLIGYNAIRINEKSLLGLDVLKNEIQPALDNLDYNTAQSLCAKNECPMLNILRNGLETTYGGHLDAQKMDQAFDEAASVELAKPFIYINYLQVIASVSPMVGLLGTVSGMVKAFRTIATQGMGRPELLANNISEALVTTASGLIVAIPALIAYFYFKNKYGKIASQVSQVLGKTLRSLSYQAEKKA